MTNLIDDSMPAPAQPLPSPSPSQEFPIDARTLVTQYANFARLTGTPEELILDFGLNTQLSPNQHEPVKLTHRLVVDYFTAKRLLQVLRLAVEQHENVYGVVETDINKRLRHGP